MTILGNLSSNNLQGSIPIELSRIGNLDTLDISNNKISGSIPSSLGDLEHLLKLNLSSNHLAGFIPAEFGNLRSVMDIDLSNNELSGLIPEELSQLQNMISLLWKQPKLQQHYQAPFVEATYKMSIILHIFLVLLLVCFWSGFLANFLLILQHELPLRTRNQAELKETMQLCSIL